MPRPHFQFSGHGSRLKFEKEARENRPPLFEGGKVAWQLSDCAHLVLRNIAVRGPIVPKFGCVVSQCQG